MGPRWKDVPGYEGKYQVSNTGLVRSLERSIDMPKGGHRIQPERIMKLSPNPSGYLYIELSGRQFLVHRLVLEAFVGPCPEGMEACHGDANRTNNHIQNLKWDTHVSNVADKPPQFGEDNPNSKLTAVHVKFIRDKYSKGDTTQRELAEWYRVSRQAISDILMFKTWTKNGI